MPRQPRGVVVTPAIASAARVKQARSAESKLAARKNPLAPRKCSPVNFVLLADVCQLSVQRTPKLTSLHPLTSPPPKKIIVMSNEWTYVLSSKERHYFSLSKALCKKKFRVRQEFGVTHLYKLLRRVYSRLACSDFGAVGL